MKAPGLSDLMHVVQCQDIHVIKDTCSIIRDSPGAEYACDFNMKIYICFYKNRSYINSIIPSTGTKNPNIKI